MRRFRAGVGAIVLTMVGTALGVERLPQTDACVITDNGHIGISIELARTPEQRSKGLMGRTTLPENSGMLFIYDRPRDPDHGFWMYRTLIPLDIAFLDEDGIIGSIRQMAPCPSNRGSECPSYPAGVSFTLALEMNQGYFEAHGIDVGDRLNWRADDCPETD
ncbi:MAG: DUF192 domain-containing protein [Pseudomonadota bacterium]